MYLGKIVDLARLRSHEPRHPYTHSLLSATRSLTSDGTDDETNQTEGEAQRHDPPSGCRFIPAAITVRRFAT